MKILLTLAALAVVSTSFGAEATGYQSNLDQAIETAKSGNKMMFVIYGRENCGNCQATKAMIKSRQIKVPDSKFVLVDLNCDDRTVAAGFSQRFGKENFGNVLPFVVVADSSGNALASSGGYKSADDWEKILKAAQKKAGGTAPGAAGTAKPAWPFGKATPAPATPAR